MSDPALIVDGSSNYVVDTSDNNVVIDVETGGNDSYTVSLLHMNGVDAAVTFPDSAMGSTHTWTANGNAQVDTAQSKFGGACGLFDGTGDYLSTGDSADWNLGSGDWTIDFWVRFNSISGYQTIYEQYQNDVAYLFVSKYANQSIRFYVRTAGGNVAYFYTYPLPIQVNTWYHVTIVRNGNTPLIFLNGVSQTVVEQTTISGKTLPDLTGNMQIGRSQYPGYPYDFNGWLDECRWSKGIARWTANFTPFIEEYSPRRFVDRLIPKRSFSSILKMKEI